MKKIRIAIIGLGHVHAQHMYEAFQEYSERIEWIGIADIKGTSQEERELHIKLNAGNAASLSLYDDYNDILEQSPELVLCGSGIKDHVEVAAAALKANATVILEKPMAMCFEDAAAMYTAHLESKGELIVNWPIAWFGAFRKAKVLIDAGAIGEILRVQYRTPATLGPYSKNDLSVEERSTLWWYKHDKGGGSILDYAGYSATLATWFLGDLQAKTVYGLKKNVFIPFSDAEDYSFFMADYGKAIALMEGSWSTVNSGEIPTGPVIYGTKGTIVCDRFSDYVKVYTSYRPYKECLPPDETYRVTTCGEDLGSNVLEHMINGAPLFEMLTADFNIRSAALLDAGRTSCETGLPEAVKKYGGSNR